MKILYTNQNKNERILRLIISLFLLPAPYLIGFNLYSNILLFVGCILMFNAIFGTCYIYRIFRINTCKT